MCFSATASFTVAGGLAVIGAATLTQRPPMRILPFAAIPLIFAVHQAIEGAIWLEVNAGGEVSPTLKIAWLLVAQVLWPTYTPSAVLLMERGKRRLSLAALLIAGLIVSGAFLAIMMHHDYHVVVTHGGLRYAADRAVETSLTGLYLLTTVAPLLLSRYRFVLLFGVAVLAGSVVTEAWFANTGQSVWCFFAAIASGFVFLHVRETTRRMRPGRRPVPQPGL